MPATAPFACKTAWCNPIVHRAKYESPVRALLHTTCSIRRVGSTWHFSHSHSPHRWCSVCVWPSTDAVTGMYHVWQPGSLRDERVSSSPHHVTSIATRFSPRTDSPNHIALLSNINPTAKTRTFRSRLNNRTESCHGRLLLHVQRCVGPDRSPDVL